VKKRIALFLAVLPLAACGGTAVSWVSAGDPVLAVCQAPDVANISILTRAIDNANNTNPAPSESGSGQRMVTAQVTGLQHAVTSYRQDAGQVPGHPAFAAALRGEAQEFDIAAASATRLTTNAVAVAANAFSAEIQADCASFQVGTAPEPANPGKPAGPWPWGVTGIAAGGYLIMMLITSYVIAVGQRSRPRAERLNPSRIFWRSLVWWVSIFSAVASAWAHAIQSATLTKDDKKDDELKRAEAELAAANKKLAEIQTDGDT
jgi:hypothetical protein